MASVGEQQRWREIGVDTLDGDMLNAAVNRMFGNVEGSALAAHRPWEAVWQCDGAARSDDAVFGDVFNAGEKTLRPSTKANETVDVGEGPGTPPPPRKSKLGSMYGSSFRLTENLAGAKAAGATPKTRS